MPFPQIEPLRQGRCLVFTNGCFDLLHKGHLHLLYWSRIEAAKGLTGEPFLIVGLNSDTSVKRLKGPNRPIQNEMTRLQNLRNYLYVDGVIIFREDTPEELIRAIKPDVLVKGADYQEQNVIGADFVKGYNGRVAFCPMLEGISTTKILMGINHATTSGF